MSDDEKRPFFTTLPGILTGAAALIAALTTLYVAVRNQQSSPPQSLAEQSASPPSAPPAGGQPLPSPSRQAVERLASDYLAAFRDHDLAQLVSLSETPFYFDQEVVLRREDIRRKYEQLFAEKPNSWEGVQIKSIRASTIAELKQQGQDMQRDRVVRSLSMDDSDWAIQVLIGMGDSRSEGLMLFARTFNNTLRIVGMWD
jgi:hypothetical protein